MQRATLRLLSWNCGQRTDAWSHAAQHDVDVVMLQEAVAGPTPVGFRAVAPDLEGPWLTGGYKSRPWSTALAVRESLDAKPLPLAALDACEPHQLGISRAGSVAAAAIQMPGEEPVTVVSVYAAWEDPIAASGSSWIYADASAHRLISDLSALIGVQRGHRLIVAGDWNILRGYGEDGSSYWRDRYATVFDRMSALGLRLVGPFAGRRPDPHPGEQPVGSDTTPTFWPRNGTPSRQLDFVFASEAIASRVRATALNEDDSWTDDHCPIRIDLWP